MSDKKTPGLAIVIGKGKMHDDEPDGDEDMGEEYDEGRSTSGDELADILGVKEDDKEDFMNALHAYVKACM